jgi:iron complex outermembrane receptor protein
MDRLQNSEFIAFLPGDKNLSWLSVYAQDEYAVMDDLRLTVGSRIERNDYTDYEFLPSLRAAWNPSADHLWWSAVSRAARSPSRLDADTHVPGEPPFVLDGGPSVRSEIATVYEVGYRGQLRANLSYSATVFYADYDHLRSQEIAPSGTFLFFGNEAEGSTQGVEMWASYQASPNWRLTAGLSALDMDLKLKPGSTDPVGPRVLGNDPEFQWNLRSTLDITPALELDVTVRRVGHLPAPRVEAYTAVDARLGWQPAANLEVSLIADNLLNERISEFTVITEQSELRRAIYCKLVLRLP